MPVLMSRAILALTLGLASPALAQGSSDGQRCQARTTLHDERIAACSAVIAEGRENGRGLAVAYCNRGHALTEKKELDRAMADLDEAIRVDPTHACSYSNRGRVFAFKGDYDRAIELGPDQAMTYLRRGNVYRDMDALDRAAADYGKVIALMPNDARGWRNRGLIRLFKGDNAGGIADYDKAIAFDPTDALSWNNRGQAKMRQGDKKGAIADFQKTLELRPDLQQAREALRQLGVTP